VSIAPPTLAPPDPPEVPEGIEVRRVPAWKPWTSVLALVAGLGGALAGGLVIYVIATIAGASLDNPPASVNIGATFLQDVAFIVAAIGFASLVAKPRPWHFGLRGTPLLPAIGYVVAGYVTFITFAAAWTAILNIHESDDVVKQLGADNSTAALIAVSFLVCVVAPIAEEFFFRGFFFGALRNWRGVWPAAVITGLVFGGIHVGSAPIGFLVPLAFFGFVLCLIYERTRSLYPCMALHCINNSIAFGVGQKWGWEIPVVLAGSLATIAAVMYVVSRTWGAPAPAPAGSRAVA
jgi:membrane protease YdiL (CAAX protease family)